MKRNELEQKKDQNEQCEIKVCDCMPKPLEVKTGVKAGRGRHIKGGQ